MPLRSRNPITPGQRGLVLQTSDDITQRRPKKSLVRGMKKSGGRNSAGRVTVRHRGGATRDGFVLLISRGINLILRVK